MCGTKEYMAPELILCTGYGKSVDWWALGVLLFEMSTGKLPFAGKKDQVIFTKILELQYRFPSYISSELKDLVSNLLKLDEDER